MVNINGKLFEQEEALININNRGLHYGDGVFETLRMRKGKIVFWEDHYFRLMSSMRILRMEIPMNFTMEFLEEEILKTLPEEKDFTFRIKLIVWRKFGGKYTPENNHVDYAITTERLANDDYEIGKGVYEVELFKDFYVNSGLLSTIKSTNRMINVVGSIYAKENDYENCLLLNEKKEVIEALNGNLFLISGTTIKTPPLSSGCLNGIIRKKLLAILSKREDLQLVEEGISPFELQKADELFITNSIIGIQPVSKYRKKAFGSEIAESLLADLNALVSS